MNAKNAERGGSLQILKNIIKLLENYKPESLQLKSYHPEYLREIGTLFAIFFSCLSVSNHQNINNNNY